MFNDAGENATFLIISFYSEFFVRGSRLLYWRKEGARWDEEEEERNIWKFLWLLISSENVVDNTWKLSEIFAME